MVISMLVAGNAPAESLKPVSTTRAIQFLDAVCGKSLPNFLTAPDRAERLGLSKTRDGKSTGYRPVSEDIIVWTGSENGDSGCSVAYGSAENASTIRKRLAVLGPFMPARDAATAINYRGTGEIVRVNYDPLRRSGRIRLVIFFER